MIPDHGLIFLSKSNLVIPDILIKTLRNAWVDNTTELTQFGDDIWITESGVKEHTDSTEFGKTTILLVLINDGYQIKIGTTVSSEVGVLIRFNAHRPHSLLKIKSGRFAALIWDVEKEKTISEIIEELKQRFINL